jgi:YVTN family beta-propeller protein
MCTGASLAGIASRRWPALSLHLSTVVETMRKMMTLRAILLRQLWCCSLTFSFGACSGAAEAPSLPLKNVADIPLPGDASRFDYESYDPDRHLLFIAHLGANEMLVFDTQSKKVVATVTSLGHVHGVLAVPHLNRVYASATWSDEVVVIDEQTFKEIARIPGGTYPDGMAYAPEVHKLYVSDETGETETVIDTESNQRVTTIPLGGEVGNTQYDPVSRHIFVNVQSRRQLVEIDPASDQIVARNDLTGAKGNHGLLIEPERRLAFIACEGNDKLVVFDLQAHRLKASFAVGEEPDVLAYDANLGLLYVASESGPVSLFKINTSDVSPIGDVDVGHNAHVVAVEPNSHEAYFPIKNLDGRPALRITRPTSPQPRQ